MKDPLPMSSNGAKEVFFNIVKSFALYLQLIYLTSPYPNVFQIVQLFEIYDE